MISIANVYPKPIVKLIKKLFILFLFFSLLFLIQACQAPQQACIPYFKFEEVSHYHTGFDMDEYVDFKEKNNRNRLDSIRMGIILDPFSHKLILDSQVISELHKMGFQKTELDKSQVMKLNLIFCYQETDEYETTACAAIYRDILVFKKGDQITGTAKICFSCGHADISGTTYNTDNFSKNDAYQKLVSLLNLGNYIPLYTNSSH